MDSPVEVHFFVKGTRSDVIKTLQKVGQRRTGFQEPSLLHSEAATTNDTNPLRARAREREREREMVFGAILRMVVCVFLLPAYLVSSAKVCRGVEVNFTYIMTS